MKKVTSRLMQKSHSSNGRDVDQVITGKDKASQGAGTTGGNRSSSSSNNSSSGSDDDEKAGSIPQPISSDDETEADSTGSEKKMRCDDQSFVVNGGGNTGHSRLFTPYRTLGLIATAPFCLIPHQSSESSMICLPIGDRFQFLQTDRFQSVLVSQPLPARQGLLPNSITHTLVDATLRITIVAHDEFLITLYQRTKPLVSRALVDTVEMTGDGKQPTRTGRRGWKIQDLIHMGRIRQEVSDDKEKVGTAENAAVVVAILKRNSRTTRENYLWADDGNKDDAVEVVGDDDDESSLGITTSGDEDVMCWGEIIVMVATRTNLIIQKRIMLETIPNFRPCTGLHPATYVNKIIVGGVDDQNRPVLCLVNIRTAKVIHVFRCLPTNQCRLTALEQSPAIDTIAVGTDHGAVHLINLRHDKKLFSLNHVGLEGSHVSVTSISFRNDASAMKYAIAPMAVGRSDGTITIWDLTPPEDPTAGRTILCEMRRVHTGGVSKLQYMPQEPLLVSSGFTSNAVIMHIFDNPDHSARILRQRKGHTGPPALIRYLRPAGSIFANSSDGTDATSCQILSTGGPDRTLRLFSTARSALDKEYSQGPGLEKRARSIGLDDVSVLLLPPVTGMALCETRFRDWGDIVTIHESHSMAYVWSSKRGAQSGPVLRQPQWNLSAMKVSPPPETHATSIALSPCGNFALVGTRGGLIYKYNVQSGQPRGSFPPSLAKKDTGKESRNHPGSVSRTAKNLEKSLKAQRANQAANQDKRIADMEASTKIRRDLESKLRLSSHSGFAVTGIAIDSIGKTLISVGADCKLILWNLVDHAPHKKSPYLLPSAATKLSHVRESDLAAIALEDFSIILFDCSAQAIVRRFGGGKACHTGPITDLGFNPDGRNLFSSSADGTIRVWDVPTNACIDWLSFKAPPTSLCISPTGEFLATTHEGRVSINIWSDRSYYQRITFDPSTLNSPVCMDDPVPISEAFDSTNDLQDNGLMCKGLLSSHDDASGEADQKACAAKESGLITLSGLSPGHWKNLFHLELVKERNKPKEPPTKPPSAPFFLQWRPGESLAGMAGGPEDAPMGKIDDDWASAWSDTDDLNDPETKVKPTDDSSPFKQEAALLENFPSKRRKVTHHRSHLAALLMKCEKKTENGLRFQEVSDYISKQGPSNIDVSLSTLCNGMHDLEEGLPLLILASEWLLEACNSRERYEAVNAYLHRFLHHHSTVIAGIGNGFGLKEADDAILNKELYERLTCLVSELERAQQSSWKDLQCKVQHALCLLRHFSRMT